MEGCGGILQEILRKEIQVDLKLTKINIVNNGDAVGTCGWLAKNAGSIRIGTTNKGRQGAWLVDKEGREITVLAIRGYYGDNTKIIKAENDTGDLYDPYGQLTTKVSFTEAAWEALENLISVAVAEMEQLESTAGKNLSVFITKS